MPPRGHSSDISGQLIDCNVSDDARIELTAELLDELRADELRNPGQEPDCRDQRTAPQAASEEAAEADQAPALAQQELDEPVTGTKRGPKISALARAAKPATVDPGQDRREDGDQDLVVAEPARGDEDS